LIIPGFYETRTPKQNLNPKTSMFRKNKRIAMLAIAATAGSMAFTLVTPALAQTNLVFMCFRSRTIQVPSYLAPTYQLQGAQPGKCSTSG
jgi:hypothetical protein